MVFSGLDSSTESKLFFGTVILFVLIQLIFFPSMYLASDEHEYIKNALFLSDGKLGSNDAGYSCGAEIYTGTEYISRYYIGKSFFLIPFTFFGFQAIMLSGLVIHLINIFLILFIFKKLGVNKMFAFLYLFLPVLLWASRTVYPGLLVLTGFLAGIYFYLDSKKKSWILAGFFFSVSVLMRYDAIIGLVAFAIPLILQNRKKAFYFIVGAIPIGIFIMVFNNFAYSGIFNLGASSGAGLFASIIPSTIRELLTFPNDLVIYPLMLLLVYPLLILSPYLSKKFPLKKEIALLTIFYLMLNARFTDFFAFDFSIESAFISRLRYLVPLIGVLIVPYGFFIYHFLNEKKIVVNKVILVVSLIILLIGAGVVTSKHTALLNTRVSVLDAISTAIPEGSTVIGSSDDCIYFQKKLFGDRKYFSIDFEHFIAGNPENIQLTDLLSENTYIIELYYGNRVGRQSERQGTISAERQLIVDFINTNYDNLELVYEDISLNTLRVYRWRN